MAKNKKKNGKENGCCMMGSGGCGGCAYFLGAIGAAIFYLSNATGFWMGVLGILKALIWPTMLVLEVLKYIAL
tara:strand:+ start:417 stop:635 length:219 start_codon:yes stop_codon:yes gene_type:complete